MTDTSSMTVLIVGAGPTGLVLALFLARMGVPFRIIEKNSGPGQQSRAMAVQARTLEFYRMLGFADEVVSKGIRMLEVHLREGGREVASFPIGDFGRGISPYPFMLSFPQDDHEKLLGEHLKAAGGQIEWNTELVDFIEVDDGSLRATLRHEGTEETLNVAYLCGCDGAHSTVRQGLHLGFPGGTYEQLFFVADVRAEGIETYSEFRACLDAHEFCLALPVRSSGMVRLIGIVSEALSASKTPLTFEDVRESAERLVAVKVEQVNWFSTYRVHHRVADHFRVGRAFLCGDAGHVHSPAGGQGMNTGIGDAVNLAWKLAAAIRGNGSNALLDTYETERIAFAHKLVSTTDTAFRTMTGRNAGSEFMRTVLVPHLAPILMGFSGVRKAAFRLVSQTRIEYEDSPLSVGKAGDIHAGDRLPWTAAEPDNFAPLATLEWQIHIYGEASADLRQAAETHSLPLHVFPWGKAADEAGLRKDALYLVRPDGYVGLASAQQDIEALEKYLAGWHSAQH